MDFIAAFTNVCISLLCLLIKAIALPKVPSMLLGGFFHVREENT